ncbi:MAG: tetratricopeptide repeat protein [Acidobacteria bacterium]|nr:tetratricopeptide repeat protein [Acidobacteriota bacterium]
MARQGTGDRHGFAPLALGIFVVALVVRLIHVWQLRASPYFSILLGDSHGYDEWAQQIARGDWFGHEVFYQAPLYPYVLGAIYAVAGRSLLVVRIIQALIGSASCALLGLAAARLFSKKASLAAGLMLALYAPAIFFDGLLQKSVLDVFFVCLALWLIARSYVFFGLGLASGGLSLTRENALVFVVVIAIWLVARPGEPFGARARSLAVFLAGLALVLVPVAARNYRVGGGFYVTTSQFGPNFYIGNNPNADGTYQSLRPGRGAPEYERQDATELAEHAAGRHLTPAEVSRYWTDRALDFITGRPVAWVKLMARKTALLWNATEMVDTESQESHAEWSWPLRLLGPIGHFGVIVPLALLGLVVTWGDRSRLVILHALLAAYASSVVLFYVFGRYRYPLVPLLLLFASAAVAGMPAMARTRRVPGSIATLTALLVAVIVTNWPILSSALMRAVTENNLGTALQAEQRLDEAMAHYQRAIALRADYAPVYSNMATALRAKGRLNEAVAAYERALALQPDFPDAHYNLANALLDEGRTDEAIAHFETALQSIPGSVDVHTNLGTALAAKGRADEAIKEFRRALEIDPASAQAHRDLGDLLAASGQQAEAIDHLRRATALQPSDAAAHYDLAGALLDAQQLDEAIAEFRAALRIDPNSVEAHNNLGIALGSLGRMDEALAEFEAALKLKPDYADAQRNRAMVLAARRQIGKRD